MNLGVRRLKALGFDLRISYLEMAQLSTTCPSAIGTIFLTNDGTARGEALVVEWVEDGFSPGYIDPDCDEDQDVAPDALLVRYRLIHLRLARCSWELHTTLAAEFGRGPLTVRLHAVEAGGGEREWLFESVRWRAEHFEYLVGPVSTIDTAYYVNLDFELIQPQG